MIFVTLHFPTCHPVLRCGQRHILCQKIRWFIRLHSVTVRQQYISLIKGSLHVLSTNQTCDACLVWRSVLLQIINHILKFLMETTLSCLLKTANDDGRQKIMRSVPLRWSSKSHTRQRPWHKFLFCYWDAHKERWGNVKRQWHTMVMASI